MITPTRLFTPLPPPRLYQTSTSPITSFVKKIITSKEENREAKLQNKWERYHPGMLLGDVLTMGYTALVGIQFLRPGLANLGWISLVCGELGGLINIWVALQEFKECYQAFQNGDTLNGYKMLFDATLFAGIGVLMILVALSQKVVAMGSIAAFFAATPYLLPLLFFLITLPLLAEISYRVVMIALKQDLASKLDLDTIQQALSSSEKPDWELLLAPTPFASLYTLCKSDPTHKEIPLLCDTLMEQFQADMGVDAAIEAMRLFQQILADAEISLLQAQIERTQQEIQKWYTAQYTRFSQQMMYVIAFAVSMGALSPNAPADLLNGISNLGLALPNGMALGMDTFWPFKRNIPMIVPKIDPPTRALSWEEAAQAFKHPPLPPPPTQGWYDYFRSFLITRAAR